MLKYVIFILTIVALNSALLFATEVYEQTDSQGNIVYSDTPLNPQAQKLNVPSHSGSFPASTTNEVTKTTHTSDTSVTTRSAEPVQSSLPATTNQEAIAGSPEPNEKHQHTTFAIESPKDQDTLYNQPVTKIKIAIAPKLFRGEKIGILLDGKPAGPAAAGTDLEISILERGTHQLSAVLLDDKNQVIKQTAPITVYVHRTSINNILTSPAG